MLRSRFTAAAACLAAAMAGSAAGAVPGGAERPMRRFTRLSVDDGLPQSSVETIAQDGYGFLWFGTQEGLSRYDGYRFRTHHADDRPGFLRNHEINDLARDARGDLWVATAGGLHHLDVATERFTSVALPGVSRPVSVESVCVDADDRVWFATLGEGLWLVEPERDPGPDPAAREVRRFAAADLGSGAAVTALTPAGGSGVWAAASGRLLRLDAAAGEAAGSEALHDLGPVAALERDARGKIWIGREFPPGVLRYDPESKKVTTFPQAPSPVLALLAEPGGAVWVGARDGGLSRLDPDSGSLETRRHDPADPASLPEDDVAALYLGRSGGLWIGTWNGGVSRLDPWSQALRSLEPRPDDPRAPIGDVVALSEAPDHRLWLLSRERRVCVGDPATGRFQTLPWISPEGRLTGIPAVGDRVYVASAHGLRTLDAKTGSETPLPPTLGALGLGSRRIDEAVEAAGGGVWIATERDLYRVRGEGRDVTPEHWTLPFESPVSALHETRGRLWLGSESGELAELHPHGDATASPHLLPVSADDGPGPAFVTSLLEDRAGHLWVGAREGLGRLDLDTRTMTWMGREQGLPSSTIAAVLGDSAGRIWVATNLGLTRIDAEGRMMHLGSHEGAQGSGYAEGAYTAGASGLFYFAGAAITVFDPLEVSVDPAAPQVVFTDIEISHRHVSPRWMDPGSPLETAAHAAREVTLAPGQDSVAVEFAGLYFSDPRSQRYRHRLEGFDESWIETGASRRVATYTQLPPGDYRLRVSAGTRHGNWSPEEASLEIRVLPQWWQTAWARWGGGLATVLLLGGVLKLRVWRLEREQHRLEGLVADRTVALEASNRRLRTAEVSAALQSLIAGTAHEIRNPLFAISATVDALCALEGSERHERLRESLRREVARLASLTDRLADYGSPREPRLEPVALEKLLVDAWRECEEAAERRNVSLEARVSAQVPIVDVDRRSMVQTFARLLGNAIEYSPRDGSVQVAASTRGGEVVVTIEDAGPGFPPENLARVFDPFFTTRTGASGLGLPLARRFIDSHGGSLEASNRESGGARLTVRLPLARD